jgi:RNA polymerase sporulation-specific sigma factor
MRWSLILTLHRWARLLRLETARPFWYVGTGEALPPPLTADEEAYLLSRLRKGDGDVRSILIERNLRLVVYIAKKFDNTRVGIEDLVSIGTIGLIKAVNTFDPNRRIKLATYASKCIENEILMFLRRNPPRTEVSFDEPLNVDWDGNELLLSDVLGTEPNVTYKELEEEVDRALLRKAMTRLSEREQMIMRLRFGLHDGRERTQKEVADRLGISQSYISRLEKRIIKRLRQEMAAMQ